MQNLQMVFSHVLHPLWPWTLHFRQQVLNHIPVHGAALARLLLPPQLWQSGGESPAVFCGREALLCPWPSLAAPCNGALKGAFRAAPPIQIYTGFPRMKANPSSAAAFLQAIPPFGIPPFIAVPARAKGQAWAGEISLTRGPSAQADQRIPEGLRAALLVTDQVLNKSLSTFRKATGWPRETVFHRTQPAIFSSTTGREQEQPFSS